MDFLEKFYKRDKTIQKSINIEDTLYKKVVYISNMYDISISKLINACIDELTKTENINIYKVGENEIEEKRSVTLRKYSLDNLEKLKDKYKISIYRLINIAIKNQLRKYSDRRRYIIDL